MAAAALAAVPVVVLWSLLKCWLCVLDLWALCKAKSFTSRALLESNPYHYQEKSCTTQGSLIALWYNGLSYRSASQGASSGEGYFEPLILGI